MKNMKSYMSSCMTNLKFLLEPYMKFRLGKTSTHICCLLCIEFSQALLMPYERFVILLKSRSRTHHPYMHCSYTRDRCHIFHLAPLKNILLLYWEKTPKTCLIGFPPNKCSKFLLLSLKSFVAEKRQGLCKSYS